MNRQSRTLPISESNLTVYNFIVDYIQQNDGIRPIMDDIRQGCGIASKSNVAYHLERLERLGYIRHKFPETKRPLTSCMVVKGMHYT